MAHIYMTFDFGAEEEKAQQARHKLDGWKQAFRLDKKLLYKFERPAQEGEETAHAEAEPAKAPKPPKDGKARKAGGAKAKGEQDPSSPPKPSGPVKLHLRLAFSGHERMTEERWLKRIPSEQPFKDAAPQTIQPADTAFAEVEGKFETLEG